MTKKVEELNAVEDIGAPSPQAPGERAATAMLVTVDTELVDAQQAGKSVFSWRNE